MFPRFGNMQVTCRQYVGCWFIADFRLWGQYMFWQLLCHLTYRNGRREKPLDWSLRELAAFKHCLYHWKPRTGWAMTLFTASRFRWRLWCSCQYKSLKTKFSSVFWCDWLKRHWPTRLLHHETQRPQFLSQGVGLAQNSANLFWG